MKITIIHAHWNNRGDEAALRAMLDELVIKYPDATINVCLIAGNVKQFPYSEDVIHLYNIQYPKRKNKVDYWLSYISRGKIAILKNSRDFIGMVKNSDIVLHGPGGPSIGDIYYVAEKKYLMRLDLIRSMGIKYAFYAPSMGPFHNGGDDRNRLRKRVLNNAEFIFLRETQSAEYVREFGIEESKIQVSLDSAFQHYADEAVYEKQLKEYSELSSFLERYHKVVGITVTDLAWHPIHGKNLQLRDSIRDSFERIIDYLEKKEIGVLFIPQLFGTQHDKDYMGSFVKNNCFLMDDVHDCYFQQHIIGKLYAVIGMRYHSNIFSAKMGTPFVSVAYEQKMSGFMEISGLDQYCVQIKDLSYEALLEHYKKLEEEYGDYKAILSKKRNEWVDTARLTTKAVFEVLDKS